MFDQPIAPPPRPKHPLSINQVSRLTGKSLDEIQEAIRTGRLRLTTYFERSKRVSQTDLEAWLSQEGLLVHSDGGDHDASC